MKTKKIENESKSLAKDLSPQIQASPVSDIEGDIYSNVNFSFKKPEGFELKELHAGYVRMFKIENNIRVDMEVSVASNVSNLTSDKLLEIEIDGPKRLGSEPTVEKITIAGNEGYIIPYTKSNYTAFFATKDKNFDFKLYSNQDKSVEKELDKFLDILKTFKINSGS